VAEALRQLENSIAPGEFVPAEASNTFTLSMADATAAELMPGLVGIMERDAPGITVRVVPLTTRDPRRLVDEGAVDLAVGFFPAVLAELGAQEQAGSLAAFDHLRLYDGRYVCVMRADHPLAKGPLTLKRYCSARHLLVSFSGRPFGFIDEALASRGQQRRVVMTVNQFFTAGRVVAASDLLTVLPEHFISTTGRAHELTQRELPFEVSPVHVDALWHRRQRQRPDHAWLRLALSAAAQKAFVRS
jgi:DNA-binding transcriptional LysR family regulator